jgi:uncharacterized protein (TIRG00374 family)
MALPSKMGRRMVAGMLFGMAVYVGMAMWADLGAVLDTLANIELWVIPACCGLSFANYLLRFLKWERYLTLLECRLDRTTSFLIYLAGLSMSVTPGKMGEVFKSWLVKKVNGTPIHQTAPIVIAERLTDLFGYLILVAIGGLATENPATDSGYAWVFWVALALCVIAIPMVGSERLARVAVHVISRLPVVGRLAPRVEGSFASTRILLAPREILMPTVVSVLGWGCECTGFWLVANAVVPGAVPFLYGVLAFAFSAVAGAVLIIFPGGLGVTEFLLGKLLVAKYTKLGGLAVEAARQSATGVVILARLCTLWFAVLVGFVATALFTRRFGKIAEDELEA